MPPKKAGKSKKLDPEVQRKQFEDWKLTDEYIKWMKLSERKNELKKDYPHDVNETTDDLTGEWQDFEDKLFDFAKTFKAKTKLKELKHEHVRSFFFAKDEKTDVIFDGVKLIILKEYTDRARTLRDKFVEIWRALDDIHDFDPATYLPAKKKMGKDLGELLKQLIPYMKGAHKEVYDDKLATYLRPFSNLLKTNMRYGAFEASYDSPERREVVDFKERSLVDEFCKDFNECLRILHIVETDPKKKIIANPDVRRIFNKLNIFEWEKNKIQFFYLSKLRAAFTSMRIHLIKLFVKGVDFWKIPLSNNQQFLEDVNKLIDCELISERLLGDELKRDQLNFTYDNLSLILVTPAQDRLLKKKEDLVSNTSISKLLIFKTLQKMRKILDQKLKDREKDQTEKKQGGVLFQNSLSALSPIKEERKESKEVIETSALLKSSNVFRTTQKSISKKDEELEEEEKQKKIEELERKKYGRFWLWENYIDEVEKPIFLEAADNLRHVNSAVQQDIQDQIITEGLNIPSYYLEHRELYKEEVKKAREKLDHLKMEDNKKDAINNIRPPMLWNHPKVVEEPHQFRSIAAPQECYKDNRIQNLMESIESLAKTLSTSQKHHFDELISRVVDCFNGEYISKPNAFSIY